MLKGLVLAAAFGLLGYLLNKLGWDNIAEYASKLNLKSILLILILGYFENFFDSLALRECLHKRLHPLKALFINQAGASVNMFVPFEGGEVLKISLLKKACGGQHSIAGIVQWNYISKLTKSLGIFGASTAAFFMATNDVQKHISTVLLALAAASFSIYLGFRIIIKLRMAEKIIRALARLNILKKSADALVSKAKDVDSMVNTFYRDNKRAHTMVLIYQMLARIVNLITLWYLLHIFAGYGLFEALLVYSGINLATFITLIFPNRIGVDEGAGYILFGFLGLEPALGILIQFIIRLKNTAITGVALPIALIAKDTPNSDDADNLE